MLNAQGLLSLFFCEKTFDKIDRSTYNFERWIPLLDLQDRVGAPISCNQEITMLSNLPDAELVYLLMNQRVTLSTIVEALTVRLVVIPKLKSIHLCRI